MSLTLVPAPPPAPVLEELLLPDVKAHLRIDSTFEDALIASYAGAACRNLEGRDGWLGRAFLTQSWDWTFDCFPQGNRALYVPLPPLQSVTSITVRGSDGVATVWSPASYQIDNKSEPGRIAPVYGQSWPTAGLSLNPITIRFVAGYGNRLDLLPAPIRLALIGIVSDYYEHRAEATLFGVSAANAGQPAWVETLLATYRIRLA